MSSEWETLRDRFDKVVAGMNVNLHEYRTIMKAISDSPNFPPSVRNCASKAIDSADGMISEWLRVFDEFRIMSWKNRNNL